jgi:hypothetical protein
VVKAEGIQHNWLMLGHHEIFARFTFNREWDVSETRRGGGQGDDVGCQIRHLIDMTRIPQRIMVKDRSSNEKPQVNEEHQPVIDPKQIESLVSSQIQAHEMSRQQAKNFKMVEDRPAFAAPSQRGSIPDWRGSSHGLAALRDSDPVYVGLGSKPALPHSNGSLL